MLFINRISKLIYNWNKDLYYFIFQVEPSKFELILFDAVTIWCIVMFIIFK